MGQGQIVKSKARILIALSVVSVFAAFGYWVYLYIAEGEAPSLSDLWESIQGGVTTVTGIGKLTGQEIMQLAADAGFDGADLSTAVAVALAESSGNPNALGDLNITPGGSVGLWQVNLKYHPEYTETELLDPQTNANAAFAIYQAAGNSFTPWSTFKSGAYLAYAPQPSGASSEF
jgi:hypothetical protein